MSLLNGARNSLSSRTIFKVRWLCLGQLHRSRAQGATSVHDVGSVVVPVVVWLPGNIGRQLPCSSPKLAGDGTMTRPASCDGCGTSVRGGCGTDRLASTGPPAHVSSHSGAAKITHLSSLEPRGLGVRRRVWLGHCRVDVEVASGGLSSRRDRSEVRPTKHGVGH